MNYLDHNAIISHHQNAESQYPVSEPAHAEKERPCDDLRGWRRAGAKTEGCQAVCGGLADCL